MLDLERSDSMPQEMQKSLLNELVQAKEERQQMQQLMSALQNLVGGANSPAGGNSPRGGSGLALPGAGGDVPDLAQPPATPSSVHMSPSGSR